MSPDPADPTTSGASAWLGLPVHDRRIAAAVSVPVLLLLAVTAQRDFSVGESAAWAQSARLFTLGPPPGRPVYTLAGFLAAHLPWVGSLYGLALLSAGAGAVLGLASLSLAEACDPRGDAARAKLAVGLGALCAWGAALVGPRWDLATRIAPQAMAAALGASALALLAHGLGNDGARANTPWRRIGVLVGLSFGTHSLIAWTVVAAMVPPVWSATRTGRIDSAALRTAGRGLLTALALASVVLLLLALHRSGFSWRLWGHGASLPAYLARWNWPATTTVSHPWIDGARGFSRDPATLFLLGGLLAASAASGGGGVLRWGAPVGLVATLALGWASGRWTADDPDRLADLALVWTLAGAGWIHLARHVASSGNGVLRGIASVAVVIFAGPGTIGPIRKTTRPRDHVVHTLARAAMDTATRGAILVVDGDRWAAPLRFVQDVDGRRKDVIVVDASMIEDPGYWEGLFAQHPNLHRFDTGREGGAAGVITRMRAAHPVRGIAFSDFSLVDRLAPGRTCTGNFFVRRDTRCAPMLPSDSSWALASLHASRAVLDIDPYASSAFLAGVAETRGIISARNGDWCSAATAWRAGMTLGTESHLLWAGLCRSPASPESVLARLPSVWTAQVRFGDGLRDLLLGAVAAEATGAPSDAAMMLDRARRGGLAEAFLAREGGAR